MKQMVGMFGVESKKDSVCLVLQDSVGISRVGLFEFCE